MEKNEYVYNLKLTERQAKLLSYACDRFARCIEGQDWTYRELLEEAWEKLQLQERLAREIINMLTEALEGKVDGMAIVMRGTHLCKTMRGVRNNGMMTVSHLSGAFKENAEARNEFYKLIDQQKD